MGWKWGVQWRTVVVFLCLEVEVIKSGDHPPARSRWTARHLDGTLDDYGTFGST